MLRTPTDAQVNRIRENLETLAEECLIHLRQHRDMLSDVDQEKLRNVARAALQRSVRLPELIALDRENWLRRTNQFIGAASRYLLGLLHGMHP